MHSLKSILCLVLAAGASTATAQVVKSYTFSNQTGTDANDFHVRFDRNASPPTPAPMRTSHSNDIQDNTGASRGNWDRPTTSGSNPPGNLSSNIVSYAGADPMVRNGDQIKITVPFPGPNAGRPTSATFTLNGLPIQGGRVLQIALNESFSQDAAGLCSLDLTADPGSTTYMASNIRLWTGLTASQMLDYDLLSPGSATMLGNVDKSTVWSARPGTHFITTSANDGAS